MSRAKVSSSTGSRWRDLPNGHPRRFFEWSLAVAVGDALAITMALLLFLRLDPAARWMGHSSLHDLLRPEWFVLYGGVFWVLMQKAGYFRWPHRGSLRLLAGRLAFLYAWSGGLFLLLAAIERGESWQGWMLDWASLGILLLGALQLTRQVGARFWIFLLGDRARERVAFLGRTRRMEKLLQESSRAMGPVQEVVGFLQDDRSTRICGGYARLGPLNRVAEVLQSEKISLLLLDEGAMGGRDMRDLAKICFALGRKLKVVPDSFRFWLDRRLPVLVTGLPVLGLVNLRYDQSWQRAGKRIVDLAGASVALILLSPLFLLLAAAVTIDSPGPVFVRQRRAGREGREFWILKFRSMKAGTEREPQKWAEEKDSRCTRLGDWMRRMNLDELPQLWNVWKGEMSLVGPRPEMADLVRTFSTSVHSYSLRLKMKPGMTGWAAVHGLRGNTSLQERIDYDLFYIQNWSCWMDFRILFMTLLPATKAFE
jgi:exopolysaccharide biosynthesis polyprenyl glycosylphosphotransferase